MRAVVVEEPSGIDWFTGDIDLRQLRIEPCVFDDAGRRDVVGVCVFKIRGENHLRLIARPKNARFGREIVLPAREQWLYRFHRNGT